MKPINPFKPLNISPQQQRGLYGVKMKVVHKSPDWFLEKVGECWDMNVLTEFQNPNNTCLEKKEVSKAIKYASDMIKGEKFPIVTLSTEKHSDRTDGCHRAYAAKILGIKKIPILLIEKDK